MSIRLLAASVVLGVASSAGAAVKTQAVTYAHDGVTFNGHLAWDDASTTKRPGVLVVHEWWGLNDYAKKRAGQLAEMGYVAFACDMYGEGKATEHPQEAGKMAGEVRKNLATWQGRAKASLKILQDHPLVDGSKLASIGYCFGGSTSLQLAVSGSPLKAVVSFHGALPPLTAEQAREIKAKVLICHGALDTFIPETAAQSFRKALDDAKVDYAMIYYGGAVHSFTVPGVEKAGVPGLAYNADADRRSWDEMKRLFAEVFK